MVLLDIPSALLDRVQLLSSLLYGGSAALSDTLPEILSLAIKLQAGTGIGEFDVRPLLDSQDVRVEIPPGVSSSIDKEISSYSVAGVPRRDVMALMVSLLCHRVLTRLLERMGKGLPLALETAEEIAEFLDVEKSVAAVVRPSGTKPPAGPAARPAAAAADHTKQTQSTVHLSAQPTTASAPSRAPGQRHSGPNPEYPGSRWTPPTPQQGGMSLAGPPEAYYGSRLPPGMALGQASGQAHTAGQVSVMKSPHEVGSNGQWPGVKSFIHSTRISELSHLLISTWQLEIDPLFVSHVLSLPSTLFPTEHGALPVPGSPAFSISLLRTAYARGPQTVFFWTGKLTLIEIGGVIIDHAKLYYEVCARGGFTKVQSEGRLAEIAGVFGLPISEGWALGRFYSMQLLMYEQIYRSGKDQPRAQTVPTAPQAARPTQRPTAPVTQPSRPSSGRKVSAQPRPVFGHAPSNGTHWSDRAQGASSARNPQPRPAPGAVQCPAALLSGGPSSASHGRPSSSPSTSDALRPHQTPRTVRASGAQPAQFAVPNALARHTQAAAGRHHPDGEVPDMTDTADVVVAVRGGPDPSATTSTARQQTSHSPMPQPSQPKSHSGHSSGIAAKGHGAERIFAAEPKQAALTACTRDGAPPKPMTNVPPLVSSTFAIHPEPSVAQPQSQLGVGRLSQPASGFSTLPAQPAEERKAGTTSCSVPTPVPLSVSPASPKGGESHVSQASGVLASRSAQATPAAARGCRGDLSASVTEDKQYPRAASVSSPGEHDGRLTNPSQAALAEDGREQQQQAGAATEDGHMEPSSGKEPLDDATATLSGEKRKRSADTRDPRLGVEAVGRRVRAFWQAEGAWFEGTIGKYSKADGTYLILYDDGDHEFVTLPDESVLFLP